MEQPWPPPGPWSLPRAEGEAEEESDLDVSPSSPRCPQLPGGGAQVRGVPRLARGMERCRQAPGVPGLCDPPCALFCAPISLPRVRSLMPFHGYCSIFRGLLRGSGHICLPTLHLHAHLFTLANAFPSLEDVPPLPHLHPTPDSIQIRGGWPYNGDPLSPCACLYPSALFC